MPLQQIFVTHSLLFWQWMARQQLLVGHWPAVPQNLGSVTQNVLATDASQSELCSQQSWHIDSGRFGSGGDTGIQGRGPQHVPGLQPSWRSQQVSLSHRFPQQVSPCPQTRPPQLTSHRLFTQMLPAGQAPQLTACPQLLVTSPHLP